MHTGRWIIFFSTRCASHWMCIFCENSSSSFFGVLVSSMCATAWNDRESASGLTVCFCCCICAFYFSQFRAEWGAARKKRPGWKKKWGNFLFFVYRHKLCMYIGYVWNFPYIFCLFSAMRRILEHLIMFSCLACLFIHRIRSLSVPHSLPLSIFIDTVKSLTAIKTYFFHYGTKQAGNFMMRYNNVSYFFFDVAVLLTFCVQDNIFYDFFFLSCFLAVVYTADKNNIWKGYAWVWY